MSLRVRLVLLIVALVTLVAVALSALYLNSLVSSLSAGALERGEIASQQVNAFVIDHINQHAQEYKTPGDLDETMALWNQIVATDHDISTMLEKTMTLSPAIVEINVAGQTNQILASSNPSHVGATLEPLDNFSAWRDRPLYRQLLDLIARRADYQVTVPIGITGQPHGAASGPLFTIQVVTSSVLLRSALLPQVQTLAAVSGGALALSLLFTVLATNRILRPVKRIEQTIDRIVQGSFRMEEANRGDGLPAKEFAVVESKLNLLGQQFRGAREGAAELKQDLDQLLERMASQLDVATRLTAISRLTGGVAHEIKNPLNAIALRLDLIRTRLPDPKEEISGEIDILSREVLRLDRVVKTFLDFSRPVDVKLIDLDLAALAAEVTDLLAPQARLAKIALTFEHPNGPAWIRGDADLLKQAILNLLTNAFEAMKDGGNVVVSVAHLGEQVVVEVTDDGPGIPPELRDKVFQLYFTTKSKGSGIGLAMTYRAVQLQNGTIEFESEDGRGTKFRLQFPALVRHA